MVRWRWNMVYFLIYFKKQGLSLFSTNETTAIISFQSHHKVVVAIWACWLSAVRCHSRLPERPLYRSPRNQSGNYLFAVPGDLCESLHVKILPAKYKVYSDRKWAQAKPQQPVFCSYWKCRCFTDLHGFSVGSSTCISNIQLVERAVSM